MASLRDQARWISNKNSERSPLWRENIVDRTKAVVEADHHRDRVTRAADMVKDDRNAAQNPQPHRGPDNPTGDLWSTTAKAGEAKNAETNALQIPPTQTAMNI